MKHVTAWLTLFALFLPVTLQAEDQSMTPDQTDVLEAVKAMTTAFQNGDIAAVMNAYETPATVVFEPGAPVDDAAQLSEMFTMAAGMKPRFEYAGHEVIVNGDIAVHIAPWTMTGQMPDGQSVEQSGLSIAVLRKQPDGSWRMVIDNPHGQRLMP